MCAGDANIVLIMSKHSFKYIFFLFENANDFASIESHTERHTYTYTPLPSRIKWYYYVYTPCNLFHFLIIEIMLGINFKIFVYLLPFVMQDKPPHNITLCNVYNVPRHKACLVCLQISVIPWFTTNGHNRKAVRHMSKPICVVESR